MREYGVHELFFPGLAWYARARTLAHRATVTFDDVVDEPWIEIVESDPVWCAFWRVSDRRATPPLFGAHGRTLDDLLEAARAGRGIGLVPASVANSQKWPGLAFIEVTDLPPSDIAVAWRADGRSAFVDEFIAMAAELGDARTSPTASPGATTTASCRAPLSSRRIVSG